MSDGNFSKHIFDFMGIRFKRSRDHGHSHGRRCEPRRLPCRWL